MSNHLLEILIEKFRFEPTASQAKGFEKIAHFYPMHRRCSFFNKGIRRNRKTTLIGHLVQQLGLIRKKSVLLAPTGRAAKVLSALCR